MQCEMLWHIESGSFIVLAGYGTTDTYTIMPQDANPRPTEDVWLLFKGPNISEPLCGPASFGACVEMLYTILAPNALDSRKVAKVEMIDHDDGSATEMVVTMEPNVNRIEVAGVIGTDGVVVTTDLPDGTTADTPRLDPLTPWPFMSQLPSESND